MGRFTLRKGKWRRKGNRESERLWPLLFDIFNASLEAKPFQDDADLVLGGMALTLGAANVSDQFFGSQTGGWSEGFLAHLQSPWS